MAGIAVIAFFLYKRREYVKRHRVLPIIVLVSPKHSCMDCEEPILQSNWRWYSTNIFILVCELRSYVKAVTLKCLGNPPGDRDRLNAHPGPTASTSKLP
ncbi:hypothetical protein TNCV_2535991 [Trichonephila clavipes]|nr:hypothetical protein TNCV_2535991 [Trichonephila clavipes]